MGFSALWHVSLVFIHGRWPENCNNRKSRVSLDEAFCFCKEIGAKSGTSGKLGSVKIHISDTEFIELKAYKDLVAVNFNLANNGGFASSLGLLGSPLKHGKKIGRDGVTEIEDANEFGAE